jgi:hypothetical protein
MTGPAGTLEGVFCLEVDYDLHVRIGLALNDFDGRPAAFSNIET